MSKLRDDLYQRFNGFKPVKNSKGEWYYNDPRFDEDNPNSKIKVANENSPNPKIDEILKDDMNNNPEDYYIWHTKGDDKVRSSHAARDGKIFNYNVPPEGGTPGEDYNCRCWAEPYHPNKNKQSDVAKVDLSGLPQYVENQELSSNDHSNIPYLFSDNMRNKLGFIESGNNYNQLNNEGGGIGALGKYQIRRAGLIDTGYLTKDNKWTGKNGIKSLEDFLSNPNIQEKILDEYMKVQHKYLSHFGQTNYLGAKYKGLKSNFTITDTGLLAAIHRTGIDYMNKFFQNLEKDENGMYYMDYNKITNPDLKTKFLWIETRMREFEK